MNSAPQPPLLTRESFIRVLARSRLLAPERLQSLLQEHHTLDPKALTELLVASGELTHYQSEKLLAGRWQGLVLGRYHILAPLGKGGMGTVYLARDTVFSGPASDPASLVALKILSARRAREEERSLHRFNREKELGRIVEHPNITRTLDAGEIDGIHFIAMEYVPGHSLRQLVQKNGPMKPAEAASIFADVVAGLDHAHQAGLIHRDLKPSNIMVTPEGRGKILDFGLAMLMNEAIPEDPSIVGGQGYILGTMDYIAPEQASDSTNVGPWSDLYAVGCSLYYALTGAPPFPGGSSIQKIRWHRTEEPPPVNTLNPEIPADFSRLIERLMAKQPEKRPHDSAAIRRLLLRWSAAASGSVPSHSAAEAAREIVAEWDTQSIEPELWAAEPIPDIEVYELPDDDEPAPPRPATPQRRSRPTERTPSEAAPAAKIILGIVGVAAVIIMLFFGVAMIVLLRSWN